MKLRHILLVPLIATAVAGGISPREAVHAQSEATAVVPARRTAMYYCGGDDYKYIDTAWIHTANGDSPGKLVLTKHRHSDTFCAVTMRDTRDGAAGRLWMVAKIKRWNGRPGWAKKDAGRYKLYAGPPETYLSRRNAYGIAAYGQIGSRWVKYWWGRDRFCFQWKGLGAPSCYSR